MIQQEGRKSVWITGAGKGIGRALAQSYASDNWHVFVTSRTAGDLEDLQAEFPDGTIEILVADLGDHKQVQGVAAKLAQKIDQLDLVILNAGTHIETPAKAFRVEDYERLIKINYLSVIYCLESVLPLMPRATRGQIAIMGSLAGYSGLPGAAGYGASKAALINLSQALYPELDGMGADLSLINPGFVRTPLTNLNDFPMPFLIDTAQAVRAIRKGLGKRQFEIAFPWRFTVIMKFLRIVPYWIFFAITRKMVRS